MLRSLQLGLIAVGVCLASGMAVGGYFIGQTMYNGKVAVNVASAKGLAERVVEADHATWSIHFDATGADREGVPDLFRQCETTQEEVLELLREQGFAPEELATAAMDYGSEEYRDGDGVLRETKHRIRGTVTVDTPRVRLVEQATTAINQLIARGIAVRSESPTYRFTSLNAIKPDMLREATQNARIAASEFATTAGSAVAGIRDARQGSFSIADVGASYGDGRKIRKSVRVVTTITFYLES